MDNLTTYKKVEINGKEYLLKYDFNASCDIEEVYGKGVYSVLNEEQVGFKLARTFYWAGLKWKYPGLTLQVVGNMLGKEIQENGKNIAELMTPVMDALKKSKLLGSNKTEKEVSIDDFEAKEEEEDDNPNA
ncbi:hypothetical protein ACT8ZR_09275 [Neobacillus sp. M.A.Huq-85]